MRPSDFFILGVLTGCIILYYLIKFIRKRRVINMLKHAKKGEVEAARFLKSKGYRVVDYQKRVPVTTYVNGNPYKNSAQADYIVKKNGKVYVVEVKTGKMAHRVTSARIRRQLLEYFLIYKPHGVLLLDMENNKLSELRFELGDFNVGTKLNYFIAGVIGGALVWLFLKWEWVWHKLFF